MTRRSVAAARGRLSAAVAAARRPPGAIEAPAPDAGVQPESAPSVTPILDELLRRPLPTWHDPTGPVTAAIYSRVSPASRARVEAALEGSAREVWDQSDPLMHDRLALIFGAHYQDAELLADTGMSSATPPEDVHSMGRGPLAAGGDPSIADIIVMSLAEVGYEIPDGGSVLDFGASSGRIVRVLGAWRPEVNWIGCDPNGEAIAWATANLPAIRFFESPQRPPLALQDGELDVAFAISIWSHFAEEPAKDWLAEMARVVKPGGMLVLTTHGWDTLAQLVRRDHMTRDSAETAAAGMLATGYQFYDVFGEEGDWGVRDSGWGNSFLTLEWLAGATQDHWALRLFHPARLDHNQDLIVLERRD
jgi:SAM-dependent methyltransferase